MNSKQQQQKNINNNSSMIANIVHVYFGRARTVLSTEKGNGACLFSPAKEPLSLHKILKVLSEYVKN